MRPYILTSLLLLQPLSINASDSLNWWQREGNQWNVEQERREGMPDSLFQRIKLQAHLSVMSSKAKIWFTSANCRNTTYKKPAGQWQVNNETISMSQSCLDGALHIEPSSDEGNQRLVQQFTSTAIVKVRPVASQNSIISANRYVLFSNNNIARAIKQLGLSES